MEAPFPEAGEALLAEVQAGGHQTHVSLFQGVVHHPLILLHLMCVGDGRKAKLELKGR